MFKNIYVSVRHIYHSIGWILANVLAKIKDKIAISFIKMFNAGPDVSFKGSPTVSPTTAALWISDPFLTIFPYSSDIAPLSIYFFALSHAPPVFAADIAICTPLAIAPGKKPAKIIGPNANPNTSGESITFNYEFFY